MSGSLDQLNDLSGLDGWGTFLTTAGREGARGGGAFGADGMGGGPGAGGGGGGMGPGGGGGGALTDGLLESKKLSLAIS